MDIIKTQEILIYVMRKHFHNKDGQTLGICCLERQCSFHALDTQSLAGQSLDQL